MRRDDAVLLALSFSLSLPACSRAAPAPDVPCPAGTTSDAARADAIETRLTSVPRGRAIVDSARARVVRVCFGDARGASVITDARIVVLAAGLEEGEAAARLGHLLVHARDGLPIDEIRPPLDAAACELAVTRAMTLEARAYVEEVLLQDALGARPTVLAFAFADSVRAAAPEARESIALAYLRAHPDGAPGIDALETAYRGRCR